MKRTSRQLAAAAVLFCPVLLAAQQATLPSAPSAVIAERGFLRARDISFSNSSAQVTIAKPTAHLNSDQKFSSFVEQSMSPYSTLSSAVVAGFRPIGANQQISETYANRMGRTMSDQTKEQFFTKFLLPSMLHQDPRYHSSADTGNVNRAVYAISRIFVTRDDNDKSTMNTSELLGAVLAASISSAYHPYRRTNPGEVAGNAATTIGADAGINMLREFWPDIRGHLMDHGPKLVQTLVTQLGPKLSANTVPANR